MPSRTIVRGAVGLGLCLTIGCTAFDDADDIGSTTPAGGTAGASGSAAAAGTAGWPTGGAAGTTASGGTAGTAGVGGTSSAGTAGVAGTAGTAGTGGTSGIGGTGGTSSGIGGTGGTSGIGGTGGTSGVGGTGGTSGVGGGGGSSGGTGGSPGDPCDACNPATTDGDTCSAALTISRTAAGAPGGVTINGSLCTASNSHAGTSCSLSTAGHDRFYRVLVKAGETLTTTHTKGAACGTSWSMRAIGYRSTACPSTSCTGAFDLCTTVSAGNSDTFSPSSDTWYHLVIDSSGGQGGSYTVKFELNCVGSCSCAS